MLPQLSRTTNAWHIYICGRTLTLCACTCSLCSYTCDYTDADGGAYPSVREALNLYGDFEDIVQYGVAQSQVIFVFIVGNPSV